MAVDLKPLPMAEAVEFWRSKVLLKPGQFYRLAEQYRVRAFTVSKLARASMLQEVFDSMTRVLESGQSFGDWKKSLAHVWEENGWTGKAAWRVDTIFRTNIQTAYNVGRYKQMMAVADARPYWQYSAVNDSRTRPTHRALHGRVYRADSPFWDTWYPPNGHRCRCKVKTLSERQVRERGLEVRDGNGLGELIEPIGPNGPMPARPLMPDKGFEGNPGKEFWQPDLSRYPDWMRAELEDRLAKPRFIKFRKSASMDEARAFALEAGAQVDYAGLSERQSLGVANYVNAGLAEAHELGIGCPELVRVMPEVFVNDPDSPMAYIARENTLAINPNFAFSALLEQTSLQYEKKFWSTGEPKHVIRHELGHSMVRYAAPLRYDALHAAPRLNPRVAHLVRDGVSEYATSGPLELVSEVYAGLLAGKQYDPKIMTLYRAYGGVDVRIKN
jgi:SPP1 gp7 family putative phage head morphogenesis protein